MATDSISQKPAPTNPTEALEFLAAYKKQNPTKYAGKKEALFKKYGLNVEDEKEIVPDADDLELEELAKKLKAPKAKAKAAPKKRAKKVATK